LLLLCGFAIAQEIPQPADVRSLRPPGILNELPATAPPPPSPAQVMKSLVGFVILMALAYVAGHPALERIEHMTGLSYVATSGMVFVLLGLLAASGTVGILTDSIVDAIAPVIPLGLGWMGFTAGFQFERSRVSNVASGNALLVRTLCPFAFATGLAAGVIWLVNPGALTTQSVIRDLIAFGLAASITSATVLQVWRARTEAEEREIIVDLALMERLIGVLGLVALSVFERPEGQVVAWQLPNTAWILIAIGVGAAGAILAGSLLRSSPSGPAFYVIFLGAVSLVAGMASFLRLAALAVCFLSGLLLADMPGKWRDQMKTIMSRMDKPVLFILLVVAGALWRPLEWQGWAFLGALIIGRIAGNTISLFVLKRAAMGLLNPAEERMVKYSPVGVFSLAVVLSVHDLYPTTRVSWLLTAVIGAVVLGEALLRNRLLAARGEEETA
jgi:hypothetical protein